MSAQEFDFSKRIPQLDGLRGIAILLVLLFHYGGFICVAGAVWTRLWAPFSIGWCGVDLFFVLSGFLIGGILLDAKGSQNYFRVFYGRRACRILPLYFAFLVVCRITWHALGWQTTLGAPWASFPLFLQNFWIAGTKGTHPILSITWSVAVEEQFYLTLPALIYFTRARQLPKVLLAGIVAAPCFRLFAFLLVRDPTGYEYFLLPSRMDSLLIGVAAAYLLRRRGARAWLELNRLRLWTAIEVLTLVSAISLIGKDTPASWFIGYDALALLFACWIAMALIDDRVAGALRAKWLTGLGGIAYGVYLLHNLALTMAARLTGERFSAVALATLATLAVAKLSWEYFEKPIVRLGHRAVYARPASAERPVAIGSVVAVD